MTTGTLGRSVFALIALLMAGFAPGMEDILGLPQLFIRMLAVMT